MKQSTIVFVGHSAATFGAERSLGDIVARSVALGFNAVVVIPADGPAATIYRESGARVLVVPTHAWMGRFHRTPIGVLRLWQCVGDVRHHRRILQAISPDVVVTNTSVVPSGAIAAWRLRIPHVWLVRESILSSQDQRSLLPKSVITRLVRRWSVCVGTVSDFVADEVGGPVAGTFRIRPNPPLALTQSGPSDGARHQPMRLLLLGRISQEKGQRMAVRALGLLADPLSVHLRIVGAGSASELRYLRKLINKYGLQRAVEIVDWTEDPGGELARCDVLLMTSSSEAYGRVTSEALQHGKPVVARPLGGTTEVLGEGSPFLAKDGSLGSFADLLQMTVSSTAGQFAELQEAAKSRADELTTSSPQFDSILTALRVHGLLRDASQGPQIVRPRNLDA